MERSLCHGPEGAPFFGLFEIIICVQLCEAADELRVDRVEHYLSMPEANVNRPAKVRGRTVPALLHAVRREVKTGAEQEKQRMIVNLLIERNADPNARDEAGNFALLLATSIKCLSALLSAGANVDLQNGIGQTALMSAVAKGREEFVLALLARRANIDLKDKEGHTALELQPQRGKETENAKCRQHLWIEAVRIAKQEASQAKAELAALKHERKELLQSRESKHGRDRNIGCPTVAFSDLNCKQVIGEGGFGRVYLGEWRSRGNRPVAIKQLFHQSLLPETQKSFLDELAIMSALHSKYIVPLLGACVEPGHFCMIFEIAENGSVYDLLRCSREQLPMELLLRIAHEAAIGLCDLHMLKPPILHRGTLLIASVINFGLQISRARIFF